MSQTTRIGELAAIIKHNTDLVDTYLKSNNLPTPSFDVHAPSKTAIPADAVEICQAHQTAIEATEELNALLRGPAALLRVPWTANTGLHFVVRHDIAKTFPVGEESTFAQIAAKTGFSERNVRRLIRHAIAHNRLFHEPRNGVVVHTALSKLLAENEAIRADTLNALDNLMPPATQVVNALARWPDSEEPNETAFALANNTTKSMWAFFAENPERGDLFGRAMGAGDDIAGHEMQLVLNALPWDTLDDITVVDVGGSHGSVMINLARAHPRLKCVVQDLPEVVNEGREKCPADVMDRMEFRAHDFFTTQPVPAQVYYLRSIMHNWSDKYCLEILRALVPALRKGARLLVHEFVLPPEPPGTLSATDEKRIRHMDVGMLQLLNSHQRDPGQFEELFRRADPRFRLVGMSGNPGGEQAVMEVVWGVCEG